MTDPIDPFVAPISQNGQTAIPIDLSDLDSEYEKAQAAARQDVPDGKYQCKIHGVRINKSQNGNPMLQYDLAVISGEHAGRHIFKNSMLTPPSMPYFKAELKTLGIQLSKLSELGNSLEAFLDLVVEVTKKTKPDQERANVYINRRLQIPAGEQAADGPTPF